MLRGLRREVDLGVPSVLGMAEVGFFRSDLVLRGLVAQHTPWACSLWRANPLPSQLGTPGARRGEGGVARDLVFEENPVTYDVEKGSEDPTARRMRQYWDAMRIPGWPARWQTASALHREHGDH